MKPLTDTIPKPLLPVGEKPIIESILENLKRHGIKDIFISVNYKKEIIKNYLQNGSRFGVRITYLEETKPTGTAGCLSLLPDDFEKPLIMSNGDLISDVNYSILFRLLDQFDLVVTGIEKKFPVDFGVLHSNGDGELHSWEEKPEFKYLINGGVYGVSQGLVRFIHESFDREKQIDMPELWKIIKDNKMRIGIHRHKGQWVDVGRMDDYLNLAEGK